MARDAGGAAEALAWLLASTVAVRLLPFRWLAPALGAARAESPLDVDARTAAACADVRWALDAVADRLPWTTSCLARAVAAKGMLRRRGLASTLYLGVRTRATGAIEAHAWLRCGATVLTGAAERHEFAVIASFAERA